MTLIEQLQGKKKHVVLPLTLHLQDLDPEHLSKQEGREEGIVYRLLLSARFIAEPLFEDGEAFNCDGSPRREKLLGGPRRRSVLTLGFALIGHKPSF